MKIKAFAKINLILDILGKLENNYHQVWMIMQSISLYDEITIEKVTDQGIHLTCSNPNIPADENNIAYQAAKLFSSNTSVNAGVKIHIKKNIPMSAGLAGGSADAAAVLIGLNEVFETHLPIKTLSKIGAQIGADVPFCLQGGTMLAQYTGTIISQLPDMPECHIVLTKPEKGISTKGAYQAVDQTQIRHTNNDKMFKAIINSDLKKITENIGNVFEQVVHVPERVEIKNTMRMHGALASCMTGTGSTIFGIFDHQDKAQQCKAELEKKYTEAYLTFPEPFGISIIS